MKTWILILIGVIIGLAIAGALTYSNNCYDNGLGETCQKRVYGIIVSEQVNIGDNNQLIGGCAGVSSEYQGECCENWAEENEIAHSSCSGRWEFDYDENFCVWGCDVAEDEENNGEGDCLRDSDSGTDYYTRGQVYMNCDCPPGEDCACPALLDYCKDENILIEYSCNENAASIEHECENGCNDGACKIEVGKCEDSDSGKNYFKKGSLNYYDSAPTGVWIDSCQDNKTLVEWFCDGENRNDNFVLYNCTSSCENGKCTEVIPRDRCMHDSTGNWVCS